MARRIPNIDAIAQPLIGSTWARRRRRAHRRLASKPVKGIRRFFDLVAPPEPTGTAPVFILSAGWRSGSTLLQRLVSSGEGWLLWGEPYDRSMIIQGMAQSLAPFEEQWPREKFIEQVDQKLVPEMWAATLYPPLESLRDSYRAALTTLFAEPAERVGAAHWGFKEVRFGLAEALLLKGLFPEARFLFIQRDIDAAYRSYARFAKQMGWYDRWPDRGIFTPYSFGHTWGRLTSDFEVAVPETGGVLVLYEDLISGRTDLDALEGYLGTSLDRSVLEKVVGSGKDRNAKREITAFERMLLRRGQRAGARAAMRARPVKT